MRIRLLLAALGAVATGAAADPPSRPAPSSAVVRCGHVAELEAAKAALERGDRAAALHHLEAADALLLRCEKQGIPVETPPPAEPTQTGDADAAAERAPA